MNRFHCPFENKSIETKKVKKKKIVINFTNNLKNNNYNTNTNTNTKHNDIQQLAHLAFILGGGDDKNFILQTLRIVT